MNENDNSAESTADAVSTESGFGLVEIMVSMFMLALLSISFLPLLITALKASVTNATLATGTQLINQQLDLASKTATTTPNCSAMKAFSSATLGAIGTLTDRNGNVLQPNRELKVISGQTDALGCPLTYPGTVVLRSWVTVSGKTTVIVETTARYFVATAS